MIGLFFAILAGFFICSQGVINTKAGTEIGLWETTTIVHATGLMLSLIIMLLMGDGNIKKISEINKVYLLGGIFGVFAVFSVMRSMSLLGITYSISIILIAQLLFSAIIDKFGLFGSQQIALHFTKYIGLILMVIGIIIFKFRE